MEVIYNTEVMTVTLKNVDDFNVAQTLTCGQCFRWYPISDTSYRGVVFQRVIDIEQVDSKTIVLKRVDQKFFQDKLMDYFDLHRNYSKIKRSLSKRDKTMKKAILYGQGIRILNQPAFEVLMSFIISGNNNIPRIMKAIEGLSQSYGSFIDTIDDQAYYSFPTPKQLSRVTIDDFRQHGTGYRDQYLFLAVEAINNDRIDLEAIASYEDLPLREELLQFKGVGAKIADCILLFAFHRMTAFPVDTWVKKIMKAYYLDVSAKEKEILNFAQEQFGEYAGIAQQYLFYYSRSKKI